MNPIHLLFVAVLVIGVGSLPAAARPDQALTPTTASDLQLDGKPEEAAWQQAVRLPFAAVEVPMPQGATSLTPDVRLLSADGRLVIGVTCAEDPGTAMGLRLLCAPEGAKSAADAVSIDFRPVEVRAPRFHALGPRGAGRTHYRAQGAADWTRTGAWTLEFGVPWVDLAAKPDQTLRLAVVVYTRTPNVTATWPTGAAWHGPSSWNEIVPPEGGWPRNVTVDADRIAAGDRADAACRTAWLAFQRGAATPILPTLGRADILERFQRNVAEPLRAMAGHRPDLEVPVACLLGDAWRRLGDEKRAGDLFAAAIQTAPGWREAQYGLHLEVLGRRYAAGESGGPSDYKTAFAALESASAAEDVSPWEREGVRLGRSLLAYKHGDFDEAVSVLQELAQRYPFDAFLEAHARFAAAGRSAAREASRRAAREAGRSDPKAEIETTKGRFTIALHGGAGDAPNTVKNFVYLAQRKFYDGLAFHRTVPFFLVQTGDPNAREGAASPGEVGTGTPGYAIRSEPNKRRMLRGAVVMASAGTDTEGSQFYVLTGTAMHLQGEQTVFGRVVQGMDVVDRLTEQDRIRTITLRDLDPEARYVPITVAGREPDLR